MNSYFQKAKTTINEWKVFTKKNNDVQTYRFDSERLTFVLIKEKKIFENELFWQLFSLITIFFIGISMYGANLYRSNIANENRDAYDLIYNLNTKLIHIETKIEKLHDNEKTFYSSILGHEPTDDGLWNGGTGGNVHRSKIINPKLQEVITKLEKLKLKVEIQKSSFKKIESVAKVKKKDLESFPIKRPLDGPVISGFCYRGDPYTGHVHFHQGLDMVAHHGAPVFASGDGEVTVSGWKESGYGIQIMLKHIRGYQTKYAHLSQTNVAPGQLVKRGQVIGYVGSTGYSTGPHLHYEIIKDGSVINPSSYLLLP